MRRMRKSIIAAVDERLLVGADGKMPWDLPADMKLFRKLTMGKPVVMGRRTFESLGRPLKGRTNIVLSTRANFTAPGCIVVRDLDEAYAAAEREGAEECMIIGGANVYAQAIWHADRLYLSQIHKAFNEHLKRDVVFFPPHGWWESRGAKIVEIVKHEVGIDSPYPWTFAVLDFDKTPSDVPARAISQPAAVGSDRLSLTPA